MPKFDTLRSNKSQSTQKKPQVLIKRKKTEQVHLALGFKTVRFNNPDRYPLEVLASVLGG